jgi:hypothetical protein
VLDLPLVWAAISQGCNFELWLLEVALLHLVEAVWTDAGHGEKMAEERTRACRENCGPWESLLEYCILIRDFPLIHLGASVPSSDLFHPGGSLRDVEEAVGIACYPCY